MPSTSDLSEHFPPLCLPACLFPPMSSAKQSALEMVSSPTACEVTHEFNPQTNPIDRPAVENVKGLPTIKGPADPHLEQSNSLFLRLEVGDIIQVISRSENGWWDGVNQSGQRGWFPSNFTQPLSMRALSLRSPERNSLTESEESSNNGASRKGSAVSYTSTSSSDVLGPVNSLSVGSANTFIHPSTSQTTINTETTVKLPFWIPQTTSNGDLVFYEPISNRYSIDLPFQPVVEDSEVPHEEDFVPPKTFIVPNDITELAKFSSQASQAVCELDLKYSKFLFNSRPSFIDYDLRHSSKDLKESRLKDLATDSSSSLYINNNNAINDTNNLSEPLTDFERENSYLFDFYKTSIDITSWSTFQYNIQNIIINILSLFNNDETSSSELKTSIISPSTSIFNSISNITLNQDSTSNLNLDPDSTSNATFENNSFIMNNESLKNFRLLMTTLSRYISIIYSTITQYEQSMKDEKDLEYSKQQQLNDVLKTLDKLPLLCARIGINGDLYFHIGDQKNDNSTENKDDSNKDNHDDNENRNKNGENNEEKSYHEQIEVACELLKNYIDLFFIQYKAVKSSMNSRNTRSSKNTKSLSRSKSKTISNSAPIPIPPLTSTSSSASNVNFNTNPKAPLSSSISSLPIQTTENDPSKSPTAIATSVSKPQLSSSVPSLSPQNTGNNLIRTTFQTTTPRHPSNPEDNMPRFVLNFEEEFNGGNWNNPFKEPIDNNHKRTSSIINKENNGKVQFDQDLLIIINRQKQLVNGIVEQIKQVLERKETFIMPEEPELEERETETSDNLSEEKQQSQNDHKNDKLSLEEQNSMILSTVHAVLNTLSGIINMLESIDFNVFRLMNKHACEINPDTTADVPIDPALPCSHDNYLANMFKYSKPLLHEFFELKQELYTCAMDLVITAQMNTMIEHQEDVFKMNRLPSITEGVENVITSSSLYNNDDDNIDNDSRLMHHNFDRNYNGVLLDNINKLQHNINKTHHVLIGLVEDNENIINFMTRIMNIQDYSELIGKETKQEQIENDQEEYLDSTKIIPKIKSSSDLPWYLEPEYEKLLLFDKTGSYVKTGPIIALIERLTHHDFLDSDFNNAMLLTIRSILEPTDFFNSLVARFSIQPPEGLSFEEYENWKTRKQKPIRLRVINILRSWLENYWFSSFISEEDKNGKPLISSIHEFIKPLADQKFPAAKTVLKTTESKMVCSGQGEECGVKNHVVMSGPFEQLPPAPLLPKNLKRIKLLDIDPLEMGRQLAIRDAGLFSKITQQECLIRCWGNKYGNLGESKIITEFISNSNKLTNWVSYMILRQKDLRKRVAVIRYFVQTAEKCRRYNNFSSMTAIISALYSSSIHRLKKTWAHLSLKSKESLESMNKLMNSSRNFNEYRDLLHLIHPPMVPFFGVYLTDLTFVEHGNNDFYQGNTNIINFAKRFKVFEIIRDINQYQTSRYNLQVLVEVQEYLNQAFRATPPPEEQYEMSIAIEPRERSGSAVTSSAATTTNNHGHGHGHEFNLHRRNTEKGKHRSSSAGFLVGHHHGSYGNLSNLM